MPDFQKIAKVCHEATRFAAICRAYWEAEGDHDQAYTSVREKGHDA